MTKSVHGERQTLKLMMTLGSGDEHTSHLLEDWEDGSAG